MNYGKKNAKFINQQDYWAKCNTAYTLIIKIKISNVVRMEIKKASDISEALCLLCDGTRIRT
jgi:hypothetical protein